jgi:hypothetical protein
VQPHLREQRIRLRRLRGIDRRLLAGHAAHRAPSPHAREVAHHLRQPRPQRARRIRRTAPRGDRRLLHEVVRVVGVSGEAQREPLQPHGVGEQLVGSWRFTHTCILSPRTETLPPIAG